MGTNYYWHEKPCPTCRHAERKVHIGKSSIGWSFSFRAHMHNETPIGRAVASYVDWLKVFETDGRIVNEYGDQVPVADFIEMVKAKADGKNHAREIRSAYGNVSFCDAEGHSFSDHEFS